MAKSRKAMVLAGFLLMAGVFVVQQVGAAGTAPLGTYTGTLGQTAVAAGSKRAETGMTRAKRMMAAPQTEKSISVRIDSYSSQAELDELKALQAGNQALMGKLTTYNHGTVQMGNQTYPLNSVTSSCTAGGKCTVTAVSVKPFQSAIARGPLAGKGAKGGSTMSVVRLNLNSDGTGVGSLETATSVLVSADNQVEGRGAAGSATQITNITRQ